MKLWPFSKTEKREQVAISDPYLAEFMAGRSNLYGGVDMTTASRLAVAQACIGTIAKNLAAMPLKVYVNKDAGREAATEHPLYEILQMRFMGNMTAFEGREFMIVSLLTNGNAYAVIESDSTGAITGLKPIAPNLVQVEKLESGKLRYKLSDARGPVTIKLEDEILHLRYQLSNDGVMGLSPIELARESFATALTYQEQAHNQAGRAFRAEGALVYPNAINADKKDQALTKLGQRISSEVSTSGILVLDGGMDWRTFSLSAKDAEFLESRKLSNMDIARIYGVPPTTVGITDNATYSNVDGESRALVMRCLAPMAKRIEQSMNLALLTTSERKLYFIEHDMGGLLRGDLKTRYESYRIGREMGILSQNEIRKLENMSEIEGGDGYLTPLNMDAGGE